ncbi:MAG: xanthine dehydrogenase small subunit, partial [Proteobacteria bacterium]|nr:xanthine dehydrogenase small subunit [Pseudomonadota bacterium]
MTYTAPPSIATAGSRPIRFYHRGRIVSVERESTTRTVLDWLREAARSTGTKEGCN